MTRRGAGGRTTDSPWASVPAPEVPCRLASWAEVPRSAQGIATRAKTAGWHVRCTYARGPLLGGDGAVLRIVDSIAVRMRSARCAAVGVWQTDTKGAYAYSSGYGWRIGQRRFPTYLHFGALRTVAGRLEEDDYSIEYGD